MTTVNFSTMSDADLSDALLTIDRDKFPENYVAAVAEFNTRQKFYGKQDATESLQTYKMEFRAKAGEYFRIWIVNLFLTIITLGIYSAWAKVRTRRYFYGNTYLNGSNFDYHADPKKILKGRLVMGALFALYFFGKEISPFLSLAGAIIIWAFLPWLIVRGSIFNMVNSSYRNVRFGFKKAYKEAYKTYYKGGAITLFTLGLGLFHAVYLQKRFRINSTRYGQTYFTFNGTSFDFFAIYALAFASLLVLGGLTVGISLVAGVPKSIFVGLTVFVIYGGAYIAYSYVQAEQIRLICRTTALGAVQFISSIRVRGLIWIQVTNLLAIIFTLGLAIPWTAVRTQRYLVENLKLKAAESNFNEFQASAASDPNAVGDAAVDFWDIDLGL